MPLEAVEPDRTGAGARDGDDCGSDNAEQDRLWLAQKRRAVKRHSALAGCEARLGEDCGGLRCERILGSLRPDAQGRQALRREPLGGERRHELAPSAARKTWIEIRRIVEEGPAPCPAGGDEPI